MKDICNYSLAELIEENEKNALFINLLLDNNIWPIIY